MGRMVEVDYTSTYYGIMKKARNKNLEGSKFQVDLKKIPMCSYIYIVSSFVVQRLERYLALVKFCKLVDS